MGRLIHTERSDYTTHMQKPVTQKRDSETNLTASGEEPGLTLYRPSPLHVPDGTASLLLDEVRQDRLAVDRE